MKRPFLELRSAYAEIWIFSNTPISGAQKFAHGRYLQT